MNTSKIHQFLAEIMGEEEKKEEKLLPMMIFALSYTQNAASGYKKAKKSASKAVRTYVRGRYVPAYAEKLIEELDFLR